MDFNLEIIPDPKSKPNELIFDIKGDQTNGLDKTIVNGLRRTILSSIPTLAFRTEINNSDLIVKKNDSSLHNEFLIDRIGLIPLYIDPMNYQKQYLFHLNVKNSELTPVTTITAKDFEIYPLKKNIDPNLIESINFDDYDKLNPLTEKEKAKIFRPFKYNKKDYYCIITELKTTNSSTVQEIDIYGVPSISYAYEDSKWQAVSKACYTFKKDEQLFEKVFQDKIKVNEIQKSHQAKYKKELMISESERYFHRDLNAQPYWYTFMIDAVHFMDSKAIFLQANQIIIDQLEILTKEFPKLSSGDKSLLTLEELEDSIFKIHVSGFDDTIGSIIQTYIANNMIDDKSILSVCGYKRKHPLEEIIIFTVSLNRKNKVFQLNKPQQIVAIIELFIEACNKLIQMFSIIQSISEKKL
jgi:DNA-directed RNA polymerase subunit L